MPWYSGHTSRNSTQFISLLRRSWSPRSRPPPSPLWTTAAPLKQVLASSSLPYTPRPLSLWGGLTSQLLPHSRSRESFYSGLSPAAVVFRLHPSPLARSLTVRSASASAPALRIRAATYSSCGVGQHTRTCLGFGGTRNAKSAESEMELPDDSAKRNRTKAASRTAPSVRTSTRESVKRVTAPAPTGRPRGRPRGSTSSGPSKRVASTVSRAAAAGSAAPGSSQEEHPFERNEKVTSDNENSDENNAFQETEIHSGQYELSHELLYSHTSARLQLPLYAVRYVLSQTRDGATVPFLARYRQGETSRMDETQLRQVLDTAKEVAEVHRRRQFMLKSLESRGLLTPALQAALESMAHVSQLEDAWEPYKERRTSLASRGRAEGLGPYAFALLHFNLDEEDGANLLKDLRAVVGRVTDGERLLTAIVAEDVQRSEHLRQRLSQYCRQTTRLTSTMVAKPRKKAAKELREESFEHLKKHFAFYDGKSWSVDRIAAHVVLALQRGEAKGVLKVETESGPKSHGLFMHTVREEHPALAQLLPYTGNTPPPSSSSSAAAGSSTAPLYPHVFRDLGYCRKIVQAGLQGAYDHLLKQNHAAIRRDLKKSAEQEAIVVFAHNLHHMLLQRPLSHSRILAMDPGHTHGVKCVVLDEHGGVETFFRCTLMDEEKMRQFVTQVVEGKKLNKIVIGNGTASAETAELVADLIRTRRWKEVEFAVVSEAGASVYSVSDIAKEEFPNLDVMYRGAVSIGRRVLDPLSELVKIPVRSMGIGMYQHDVNEKELMKELGYVLESCVAKVGINAVTANRYVMEKVPGIQKRIVDQIVLARHAKKLHSRDDLRRVPAMTESVYEQVAGFFRFPNSPEPLDNTNIHPESYALVRRLMQLYVSGELAAAAGAGSAFSASLAASKKSESKTAAVGDAQSRQEVAQLLQQMPPAQLAALATQTLSCTVETLELVKEELLHPGLDPRASLPHAGLLRREVHDVRDLRKGEILSGVVQSVTMFGAFVDCGLHDSVLVRGDGVDTLQVGALLEKRIRFDCLDHLKRPRMFLLPDPTDAGKGRGGGGGGGHGGSRRLRLESEDLLGSGGRGFVAAPPLMTTSALADNAATVGPALRSRDAPQSLSAHILHERRRRAAEGTSGSTSAASKTATTAAVLPVAETTTVPPTLSAPAQPMPRQSPLTRADASHVPRQRGTKRGRSPSLESPLEEKVHTQSAVLSTPPRTAEGTTLAPPSPAALSPSPLLATTAFSKPGAPRTVFVFGSGSTPSSTSALAQGEPKATVTTTATSRGTPQAAAAAAAATTTKLKPVARRVVEEIDVDAISVDSTSSTSSSSDAVFSF